MADRSETSQYTWDSSLKKKKLFIWLHGALVVARRILSCGMWELSHWPRIEPGPPTGPPGKSPQSFFIPELQVWFILSPEYISNSFLCSPTAPLVTTVTLSSTNVFCFHFFLSALWGDLELGFGFPGMEPLKYWLPWSWFMPLASWALSLPYLNWQNKSENFIFSLLVRLFELVESVDILSFIHFNPQSWTVQWKKGGTIAKGKLSPSYHI